MKKVLLMIVSLSIIIIMGSGCVTQDKAVGLSDGVDGFFLRLTGSPATGSTPAPELWCASNVFSYASSPIMEQGKTNSVVFTMSKRRSFFGSVFGVDDTSTTFSYIGTPGEKPEETSKRMEAFSSVSNLK